MPAIPIILYSIASAVIVKAVYMWSFDIGTHKKNRKKTSRSKG